MSREEYLNKVKERIAKHFPDRDLSLWNDEEWQGIINGMYDRFSNYTIEKQQELINEAGPKEPFWERVVSDGAYAYHMWA